MYRKNNSLTEDTLDDSNDLYGIINTGCDNMPTHKIHLAISKRINNEIKMDQDSIMLGSVLPDICLEKDHSISHFQVGEKDIEGLANPEKFVQKYKKELSNPVMIGYLIHILTDKFYNEYIFKNYYIYDEHDNGIGICLKGKKKYIDGNKRKYLKHRELDLYDKWILNSNQLCKFKSTQCINNVVNIEEATFDQTKLKEYILSANKDIDKINIFSKLRIYNYKIMTKKELDKLFENCIEYIINYLKSLNLS